MTSTSVAESAYLRVDTCLSCDAPFTQTPAHPMWEFAHCRACYPVIAQTWHMAYVLPADIGRALRAEDV